MYIYIIWLVIHICMVHRGYHPTNKNRKQIQQEFWPSRLSCVHGGGQNSISLCQEAFMMWRVFQFIEYDSWAFEGPKWGFPEIGVPPNGWFIMETSKINICAKCTQRWFFSELFGKQKVQLFISFPLKLCSLGMGLPTFFGAKPHTIAFSWLLIAE